jgi:hypothetical protein
VKDCGDGVFEVMKKNEATELQEGFQHQMIL